MPITKQLARVSLLSTLVVATAVSGCGKTVKEAVLAPAEGTVLINGKPAENILVQFLPQVKPGDPGPTSSGVSDREGRFLLETTDGKQGAVVGPCKVTFVDMTEERVPQGQVAKPSRVPLHLMTLGPGSRDVEVKAENALFDFEIGGPGSGTASAGR